VQQVDQSLRRAFEALADRLAPLEAARRDKAGELLVAAKS
jgi:hypothetical protein